jgi:hypothetical protein
LSATACQSNSGQAVYHTDTRVLGETLIRFNSVPGWQGRTQI